MPRPVAARSKSAVVAKGSSLFTGEHSTERMRNVCGSSDRNVATSAVLPMPISPFTTRATM